MVSYKFTFLKATIGAQVICKTISRTCCHTGKMYIISLTKQTKRPFFSPITCVWKITTPRRNLSRDYILQNIFVTASYWERSWYCECASENCYKEHKKHLMVQANVLFLAPLARCHYGEEMLNWFEKGLQFRFKHTHMPTEKCEL